MISLQDLKAYLMQCITETLRVH